MKTITSKDERKKQIVEAFKRITNADKVTNLTENETHFFSRCMEYNIYTRKYSNPIDSAIEKSVVFPTAKQKVIKHKSPKKRIKGKTVEQFIDFLEQTLIPDLKESGSIYKAEDFETAVKWIKHFKG